VSSAVLLIRMHLMWLVSLCCRDFDTSNVMLKAFNLGMHERN